MILFGEPIRRAEVEAVFKKKQQNRKRRWSGKGGRRKRRKTEPCIFLSRKRISTCWLAKENMGLFGKPIRRGAVEVVLLWQNRKRKCGGEAARKKRM